MSKVFFSLDSINKILKKENPSSVCLVTSRDLKEKLNWAIKEIKWPKMKVLIVPRGEEAKEWNSLEKLLKQFIGLKLDRKSIIIALGGGAIGDLVGFAASIYLREIKFIQIPTTLLAQVDSAHGGKTAINFLGYKNQIGSFYSPLAIIVDVRFIESLADNQIIDGLGEIIKAGLIKDISILTLLKKENLKTIKKSPNLLQIIKKAIKVKQYYTDRDAKDSGVRQMLNVGHTVGHAIELKYGISHGKAVIVGTLKELEFTESLGFTGPDVRKNLEYLLISLGIHLKKDLKATLATILHDKKISGNKIAFPTVIKEGESKLIMLDIKNLKVLVN